MRRSPIALTLALALSFAVSLSGSPRGDGGAFTVVMLPDTQHYSDSPLNIVHFNAQTQWCIDNLASERIAFVAHVGDIVQDGAQGAGMNQVQWDRADGAMDTLDGDLGVFPDGLVPYSAAIGNHDFDVVGNKSSADQYIAHFGPARYAGRSWFLGASGNELNMAQVFEAQGESYLGIGMEWHPSDEALAWAQEVLAAHPRLPTILSTHEFLLTGFPAPRSTSGGTPNSGGDNSGESVFEKLVEPNPQIFLVLCGHVIGDGRRTDADILGGEVHQVLADYQGDPGGGNGWMPVIELRPAEARIEFRTFSPTYVPGVTPGPNRALDPFSNFVLDFDLDAHRERLEGRTILRFREGQDSGFGVYAGTQDTHIGDGGAGVTLPDTAYGNVETLRVDADEDREQALLRFADIIGDAPGQIPPGSRIERAFLTLTTEGVNSDSNDGGTLHRMIAVWNEGSTWNSLGNGVQLGPEANPAIEVDTGGAVFDRGTDSFDVTASVQAWADGVPNRGWVFLAGGFDRWELRSSDWSSLMERPALTVVLEAGCPDPSSYCNGAPNSAGAGSSMAWSGSTSVSANELVLRSSGNPLGQTGVFFYGPEAAQIPFGEGFLCVGAGGVGLFRLGPPTAIDANGQALRALDLSAPPASTGLGEIEAGSSWNFQWWYRDPSGGPAGFNLSDALRVQFCP